MAGAELSRLLSPAAVQFALDEFARIGRTAFLERYGFGKSRDFLVRNPANGELCESKEIIGAAWSLGGATLDLDIQLPKTSRSGTPAATKASIFKE